MNVLLRYWPWLVLLLMFGGGYGIAFFKKNTDLENNMPYEIISAPDDCLFNEIACEININGNIFRLIVEGEVIPLKPFKIMLQNSSVQQAIVSFSMVDMDMGVNRFVFKKAVTGGWATSVVLPVCSVRRKDWLATFYIDLIDGKKVKIEYPFNTQ